MNQFWLVQIKSCNLQQWNACDDLEHSQLKYLEPFESTISWKYYKNINIIIYNINIIIININIIIYKYYENINIII